MKIVFIRHQKDFSSTEELIELASGSEEDAATLSFAHVQILPVIVDSEGIPLVESNQFLAYVASRSDSATGDTARTYSESLLS